MSRTVLILILVSIGTSCSLMPGLLDRTSAQSEHQSKGQSKEPPSPQLMQRFEQKIAAKLLAEAPEVLSFRTAAQAAILIEKLDKLVNQSGLNLNLLTSPQRNQLLTLSEMHRALIFEQQYWTTRNHLAAVSHLPPLVTSIQANLQDQAELGILYPERLQIAAISALRQLPEDQRPNELDVYLGKIPTTSDVGPWIRARLKPFFTEQQLIDALVELENASSRIRVGIHAREKNLNRSLEAFYSDPRYDIRLEATPEQLTLDIISLHIEEALQFSRRENAVTILGVSSTSASYIKIDDNGVTVFLDPITELPAFEFQSIAYQTAGELLASARWPFPWRNTLALAYGQWVAEKLIEEGYFSDEESKLARLSQHMLFNQLGVIEAKLALGQWRYSDAKAHLQKETPYTAEQVDRWLRQMLAEDGSYAAAALAANAFSEWDKDLINVIEKEMERQLPVSLSDFLNRPAMQKISATIDLIDS